MLVRLKCTDTDTDTRARRHHYCDVWIFINRLASSLCWISVSRRLLRIFRCRFEIVFLLVCRLSLIILLSFTLSTRLAGQKGRHSRVWGMKKGAKNAERVVVVITVWGVGGQLRYARAAVLPSTGEGNRFEPCPVPPPPSTLLTAPLFSSRSVAASRRRPLGIYREEPGRYPSSAPSRTFAIIYTSEEAWFPVNPKFFRPEDELSTLDQISDAIHNFQHWKKKDTNKFSRQFGRKQLFMAILVKPKVPADFTPERINPSRFENWRNIETRLQGPQGCWTNNIISINFENQKLIVGIFPFSYFIFISFSLNFSCVMKNKKKYETQVANF